jgi:hypothetical protein
MPISLTLTLLGITRGIEPMRALLLLSFTHVFNISSRNMEVDLRSASPYRMFSHTVENDKDFRILCYHNPRSSQTNTTRSRSSQGPWYFPSYAPGGGMSDLHYAPSRPTYTLSPYPCAHFTAKSAHMLSNTLSHPMFESSLEKFQNGPAD